MTQPIPAPIDSPAAWRGPDLAASGAWRRKLSQAEIAALLRATEASHAALCPGFAARHFPVVELAPLFAWMAEQLEHGPGVVRLSGLPVEDMSRDALKRLFWGFCATLGTPLHQNSTGEILAEVKDETGVGLAIAPTTGPVGAGSGPVVSARTISRSAGALRFHTDKCDLLALLCASNGVAGGVSKIASSVTVHNEIARRRPDLLKVLYQPFWRMRPADEEGDRPDRVFAMPVFARAADGGFTSQYSRTYVNQAQEDPSVPRLTDAQNEAMDLMAEIADETCLQAAFEPGDMQFLTQHVTYHGRTAFTDDRTAGAERVLLRIWLAAPFSRLLPIEHAVQWGDVRPGALRGGALTGRSAVSG